MVKIINLDEFITNRHLEETAFKYYSVGVAVPLEYTIEQMLFIIDSTSNEDESIYVRGYKAAFKVFKVEINKGNQLSTQRVMDLTRTFVVYIKQAN